MTVEETYDRSEEGPQCRYQVVADVLEDALQRGCHSNPPERLDREYGVFVDCQWHVHASLTSDHVPSPIAAKFCGSIWAYNWVATQHHPFDVHRVREGVMPHTCTHVPASGGEQKPMLVDSVQFMEMEQLILAVVGRVVKLQSLMTSRASGWTPPIFRLISYSVGAR